MRFIICKKNGLEIQNLEIHRLEVQNLEIHQVEIQFIFKNLSIRHHSKIHQ